MVKNFTTLSLRSLETLTLHMHSRDLCTASLCILEKGRGTCACFLFFVMVGMGRKRENKMLEEDEWHSTDIFLGIAQLSSFHPLRYLSKESHANLKHPEKLWLGQVYFPRTKPHATPTCHWGPFRASVSAQGFS